MPLFPFLFSPSPASRPPPGPHTHTHKLLTRNCLWPAFRSVLDTILEWHLIRILLEWEGSPARPGNTSSHL